MKLRDIVSFVLLCAGIVGVLGGIGAISRGMGLGWVGIAVGVVLMLATYRAMKRFEDVEVDGDTP